MPSHGGPTTAEASNQNLISKNTQNESDPAKTRDVEQHHQDQHAMTKSKTAERTERERERAGGLLSHAIQVRWAPKAEMSIQRRNAHTQLSHALRQSRSHMLYPNVPKEAAVAVVFTKPRNSQEPPFGPVYLIVYLTTRQVIETDSQRSHKGLFRTAFMSN